MSAATAVVQVLSLSALQASRQDLPRATLAGDESVHAAPLRRNVGRDRRAATPATCFASWASKPPQITWIAQRKDTCGRSRRQRLQRLQ